MNLVPRVCGAEGSRTLDLYNANVALSQLSYCPELDYKCTEEAREKQEEWGVRS